MNNTTFLDAEESSGFVQGLSFREIVLNYVKVIGSLSKVELRGGYWFEKTLNTSGATTKIWEEDTRECYVNSIKYLSDILYPHFDEKMMMFFSRQEHLIKEQKSFALDKITSSEDNKTDIAQDWRRLNVDLHRDIFREINCFLYRSNYLEIKIVEDEI